MSQGTFDGEENATGFANANQALEEVSLVGGSDDPADDWNNQILSTSSKCARSADRLQQEELLRIQHRRSFYEQHPQVNNDASFSQTFGNCAGSILDPDALKSCTEIDEQLQPFVSIQPDALTPWERFLTIDPTNEPCLIYAKCRMATIGLQLGNAVSAKVRVRAAATLAEQTKCWHAGRKRRLNKLVSADKAAVTADPNRRKARSGRGEMTRTRVEL